MRSCQPLAMAKHAVPGWLINETRGAHARVPVVVGEMMKSALRNCTTGSAIRFERNRNIEPNTRYLARAPCDDPSSRARRCAYCAFVRMTREKADRAIGYRGIA